VTGKEMEKGMEMGWERVWGKGWVRVMVRGLGWVQELGQGRMGSRHGRRRAPGLLPARRQRPLL
jgi:hypothetical protein